MSPTKTFLIGLFVLSTGVGAACGYASVGVIIFGIGLIIMAIMQAASGDAEEE